MKIEIENKSVETLSLLNSGAGGEFIDQNYAKTLKLPLLNLEKLIPAVNVDGTLNKKGTIKQYVNLYMEIFGQKQIIQLLVTGLGKQKILLGFPWLQKHNPVIDWKTGSFQWQYTPRKFDFEKKIEPSTVTKSVLPKTTISEEEDPDEWLTWTVNALGTNYRDVLLSPLIEIEEHIMDKGAWINPEINSVWICSKTNLATDLAIKENQRKDDLTDEKIVPSEYHEFLDIFGEKRASQFPDRWPWDHKINLKPGFELKSFKNYNLTPTEQEELDGFLKENLEKGYIKKSKSPMASPFFFIKEKDRKLRPCQDYRFLNEWTIKNAYPLPLISEIMDKLKGTKYFTKLDVQWGYNNIRIWEGDEWKAVFKTNQGLFEPTVMFFGMCNSPATFQSMMDSIFIEEIEEGVTIVYMDDILIYATTPELLRKHTKWVLQKLRDHDLFLKAQKCEFNKEKVEYLGLMIEEGKVSTDPVKVKGFADWPIPQSVKNVQLFLGFRNFYRKFIPKFSTLAAPLNNLLKKDTVFEWTPEAQQAFEELKQWLTSALVLLMPDQTKPFQIKCDASKYASGVVLTQLDNNGDCHLVAFLLKTFNKTEHNYEIYGRELLALIRALEEWRHYIQGSGHTTIVHSDHQNLTYFRAAQKLNQWQARWSLYLLELDVKLIHQPGSKMVQSNALSWGPDFIPNHDTDNENMTLLPEHMFLNLLNITLQDRVLDLGQIDDFLKAFSITDPPLGTPDNWRLETIEGRNTLFYKGRNYVPDDMDLRWDILWMLHDHETAGHPGEAETLVLVERHYWWPGLCTFVCNYVKGCGVCQQYKINQSPAHPSYMLILALTGTQPFAHCSMDLITDLPLSNGFDSILVVVNHGLTKGVILMPCNKTITTEQVANLLLEHLYKWFRLPDEFIFDRGPQFTAHAFWELLKLLGITSKLSTTYHPQTDGATGRVNQEIKAYLSIFCSSFPEDWAKKLYLVEFTHNNWWHANRKHTPFELMYGESPKAMPIMFGKTKYPLIKQHMHNLIPDREEALAAHKLAMRRIADRQKNTFVLFKVGDKVWLYMRNIKTTYNPKIGPRREGPFEISDVLGPLTYRLNLPNSWWIHNVFHAILLWPYVENDTHRANFPRPPPELLEGEEVYEVESILKHRCGGRGYQYLIKWKGYLITKATWEAEMAFSNDGNMLTTYKDWHQLWKRKETQCPTHIHTICFPLRPIKNGLMPIGKVWFTMSVVSRMNVSI